jgi:hypothetical protein
MQELTAFCCVAAQGNVQNRMFAGCMSGDDHSTMQLQDIALITTASVATMDKIDVDWLANNILSGFVDDPEGQGMTCLQSD